MVTVRAIASKRPRTRRAWNPGFTTLDALNQDL